MFVVTVASIGHPDAGVYGPSHARLHPASETWHVSLADLPREQGDPAFDGHYRVKPACLVEHCHGSMEVQRDVVFVEFAGRGAVSDPRVRGP